MAKRKPDSGITGLLNVHKPAGPTSHDIVATVRRGTGQRRVGHAGTLDPLASGVLVLALGKATRLLEYLLDSGKSYRATVRLGLTTDTYDLDGTVTDEAPLPTDLDTRQIDALLQTRFVGDIMQTPPVYSALKIDGKTAHSRARAGEDVQLQPRPVTIQRIELLATNWPDLILDVECSKGTYIRSLAHDLGQALGCGATLAGLVRTASGHFIAEDAVPLDRLQAAFEDGSWQTHLLPAAGALTGLPAITLDAKEMARLKNGQALRRENITSGLASAIAPDGQLAAVLKGDLDAQVWRPVKVLI